jgi:hypothetical protein
MSKHLTTAQLSEWIAGERSAENAAHLKACATCRTELTGFESGLVALGQSVRTWAARQDLAPGFEIPKRSSWRWALAGVAIAVAVLLPARWNTEARREAALREDAQLLEHIDMQLSRSVPATMEPLMILMQEGKEERQ